MWIGLATVVFAAKPAMLTNEISSLHLQGEVGLATDGVHVLVYNGKASQLSTKPLTNPTLSSDGQYVTAVYRDRFIQFNLDTGAESSPSTPGLGRAVRWLKGEKDLHVYRTNSAWKLVFSSGKVINTRAFRDVSMSNDGQYAFIDTGHGLEVRQLSDGQLIRRFSFPFEVSAVHRVSVDANRRVVVALVDAKHKQIRLWCPPDSPLAPLEVGAEDALSLSGDGQLVAVASPKGVFVLQTKDGAELLFFKQKQPISSIALNEDGSRLLIALKDGSLYQEKVKIKQVKSVVTRRNSELDVGRLPPTPAPTLPIDKPDLTVVLPRGTSGLVWGGQGLTGWVGDQFSWVNISNNSVVPLVTALGNIPVDSPFAWAPDGHLLAMSSPVGIVLLNPSQNFTVYKTLKTSGGHARLLWSGQHIVFDSSNSTQLHRIIAETGVADGVVVAPTGMIDAKISPDGKSIIGIGKVALIADLQTGKTVGGLVKHAGSILCASWAPNGASLVTAGADATLLNWNASTWEVTSITSGIDALAIDHSPDGEMVVVANNDGAYVIATKTGRVLKELEWDGLVASVDWGPEGIAIAGATGSLSIWRQ